VLSVAALSKLSKEQPEVQFGAEGTSNPLLTGADQLVVLGDLPAEAPPDCASLNQIDLVTGVRVPIGFQVIEASQTVLTLSSQSLPQPGSNATYALSFVARCFGSYVSYEVRTYQSYRAAFTPYDSSTSYAIAHRVIATADGTCAVDTNEDPRLIARAFPGVQFNGLRTTVKIGPPGTRSGVPTPDPNLNLATNTSLNFTVRNVPNGLAVYIIPKASGETRGGYPALLTFSPYDQRLYAIESSKSGLVMFGLYPFGPLVGSP
jgi:hypothetical protein